MPRHTRIATRSNEGAWEVTVWGNNLTDEFCITSAADLLAGFGYDYTHRGAPRTYGLKASWHF